MRCQLLLKVTTNVLVIAQLSTFETSLIIIYNWTLTKESDLYKVIRFSK